MNRKNIPKPVTQTTGLSYWEVLKIRAVNALQFFPYSIMTKYHPAGVFRRDFFPEVLYWFMPALFYSMINMPYTSFFYTSSSMLYTHG